MPDQIIELRDGNAENYKQSNHILNFISSDELKKLDILELCKFADYHGWSSNLACHGGGCLFQFKHALYVLIHKNKFIEKFKENPDFAPDTHQTSIDQLIYRCLVSVRGKIWIFFELFNKFIFMN